MDKYRVLIVSPEMQWPDLMRADHAYQAAAADISSRNLLPVFKGEVGRMEVLSMREAVDAFAERMRNPEPVQPMVWILPDWLYDRAEAEGYDLADYERTGSPFAIMVKGRQVELDRPARTNPNKGPRNRWGRL